MKGVPPDVDVSESWASNLVPVGLGVIGGSDSKVLDRSADGPSGLSDPDIFAIRDFCGVGHSFLEQRLSAGDGVRLCVLEVWVSVNSEPVNSADDIGRRASIVGPRSPCVDVADRRLLERSALDSGLELVDACEKDSSVFSDTGAGGLARGRITVEIFTSNRDTNNEVGPSRPLSKSGGQGGDLGSEFSIGTSCPKT